MENLSYFILKSLEGTCCDENPSLGSVSQEKINDGPSLIDSKNRDHFPFYLFYYFHILP